MKIQRSLEGTLIDNQGIPLVFKSQTFTPKDITSNSSFSDYQNKSLYSIIKKLNMTDEAFVNSILAFASYTENDWMRKNLNKELHEMSSYLEKAFDNKDEMYKMKIWHFMKNTFEPIPYNKIKIPSQNIVLNSYKYMTEFDYKDGEYTANNGLAHASIMTSKNPTGKGKILHLSFRGTEFSRITEYLTGPYLDMTAYYQHFKPLERYIKEYISNPSNEIDELHVNGHSLGGAMVQEFLKNNNKKDFPVPIKGFTFGSPGSEKKWYHQFATLAYHTIIRGISVPIKNIDKSPKDIDVLPKKDNRFHQFANIVYDTIIRGISVPMRNIHSLPKNDRRLHEFYHSNDPVPKVGLLGYQKNGESYNLFDTLYKDSKSAKLENNSFLEKIPVFGNIITSFKEKFLDQFNKKFHNSGRYIMNIRSLIEDHYSAYPELGMIIKDNSKHWENWIRQEKKFSALSIRLKGAFEYLVEKNNPELDKMGINTKILQIREKMKYDSQAELVLSKTRITTECYEQYLSLPLPQLMSVGYKALDDGTFISTQKKIDVLREIYGTCMEERTKPFKKI